ncbi:MAG TPA: hypothetical protein VF520_01260 [Thermoleophilaceae bacterium]|jgi:hypothetical protein
MEAATPLRAPNVRTLGDRLVVDGLVVQDECAVRLVREREEAGDDPARAVSDAIEIGARVLDREQAGANADFVRSEFDKVSREVEAAFVERAREVSERLEGQVEAVFGPETGHLTKTLERHFSDESSAAVQNRVRELLGEATARLREDLLKQFTSADGHNPLAEFKAGVQSALREARERDDAHQRALQERLARFERELQALRDERAKREEVDAERERGTAKGRTFEEAVTEAIEEVALAQGDDCEAVGDLRGASGRSGDVVVAIDACRGPTLGRIVFEAKTQKLSKPKAWQELDSARAERDADFAVLVVPSEEKLPARTRALREYGGDKLLVAWDPDGGGDIALEVAYSLARARVLMARGGGDEVDAGAIRDVVDRALAVVDDTRKVKSQLTGAKTSIDGARSLLEEMENHVRGYLREIEALATAGAEPPAPSEGAAPDAEPAALTVPDAEPATDAEPAALTAPDATGAVADEADAPDPEPASAQQRLA